MVEQTDSPVKLAKELYRRYDYTQSVPWEEASAGRQQEWINDARQLIELVGKVKHE